MLIYMLIFICILQFVVLAVVCWPILKHKRPLKNLRPLSERDDKNYTEKDSKLDKFETVKEASNVPVSGILNNPLASDLKQDVDSRMSKILAAIEKIVENYFVFVGLSAALTAMSLVAVIFNFTGHVIEPLDHRDAVVSYSVFFAVFTMGLVKNRAVKRRFQKLNTKQERLEELHKGTIEQLKDHHKTSLDEQERAYLGIVEKLEQEISGLKQQLPAAEEDEVNKPRRILDVFTRNPSPKED